MKQFVYVIKVPTNQPELQLNDVGYIEMDDEQNLTVEFMRISKVLKIEDHYVEKFDIEEVGDRFTFKVCDRCFKYLETSTQFENNRIKKDNVVTKRPSCRECRVVKNGKSISPSDRQEWDKKKPKNYTPFTCPICNKTTIAGISKIVLDHCHITGSVRGYICESCNTGIGRFDDNPELIVKAINWLNRD